jgi:dTMP kinase
MRGRLLVFEGGEGAGKTTQLQRLSAHLAIRGIPHMVYREPGGTPVGDRIRDILLHSEQPLAPATEAALFVASRAQLVATMVRPALEAGTHVLLDRFLLSTYAYQIHGRGLAESDIRAANQLACDGLAPDLTLLMRVPVGEGLIRAHARSDGDRFERASREFHDRVAAAFDLFTTPAWQRGHQECGPIMAVDAIGEVEEVSSRVMHALQANLPDILTHAEAIA